MEDIDPEMGGVRAVVRGVVRGSTGPPLGIGRASEEGPDALSGPSSPLQYRYAAPAARFLFTMRPTQKPIAMRPARRMPSIQGSTLGAAPAVAEAS